MFLLLGASIIACCDMSRYIVVLEENKDIFDTIFKPKRKSTPTSVTTQLSTIVAISKDPNDMPIVL